MDKNTKKIIDNNDKNTEKIREIGECDKILKLALDKHFNGKSWHFTTQNNIF